MHEEELEAFRWRDISMVFQSAMNALNPGDDDRRPNHRYDPGARADDEKGSPRPGRAPAHSVGIDTIRLDSYPHQLSGGMRQRAVIAIALALDPPLMIMDEPTTALDVVVQKEIMQQIEELKEKLGFSILFITHDLSLLVEFSDRIAIMYAGEIVEHGVAEDLFDDPLHPYTQGLDAVVPVAHRTEAALGRHPGIAAEHAEAADRLPVPPALRAGETDARAGRATAA